MSIVLRKDLSIITDGSISKLESNLLMTIEALPGLHICSYSFTNNIYSYLFMLKNVLRRVFSSYVGV